MHSPLAILLFAWLLAGCSPTDKRDDSLEITRTENSSVSPVYQENLRTAESLIDAFYSFEPEALRPFLESAPDSASTMLYYQGWAEGGNYQVIERKPCAAESNQIVRCAITVRDDPVQALRSDFNVTDTFTINFSGGKVIAVETSSNDQPIYHAARNWLFAQQPELLAGPCSGFYAKGKTPGDCARAVTEGFRQYYDTVVVPNIADDVVPSAE